MQEMVPEWVHERSLTPKKEIRRIEK